MKFIFVLLLAAWSSMSYAGSWWSGSPIFNSGANDSSYVIGTADDTTGGFQLSPATSVQLQMIGTAATDSSAVAFYPVFAAKGSYSECGSVPISRFSHKWGTMDSTDFVGVYDVSTDSTFSIGVNIAPDAACECARIVVKGLALNDSSYVITRVTRYTE